MSKTKDRNSMNRRAFLKFGVVGVAAVAGLSGLSRIIEAAAPASKSGTTPVYRTLGRTGVTSHIILTNLSHICLTNA
jgi:hypothetical protein